MSCTKFSTREMSGIFCTFSDAGTHRIEVRGKSYWFEWSDRFGPWFVTKTGKDREQMRIPNYVLDATTLWQRQGKEVIDGVAVWNIPPPVTYWLSGKIIVETETPEGFDPDLSEELYRDVSERSCNSDVSLAENAEGG